jgi:hypothetical protein
MSATLPPTAGLDRSSDFGELWQQAGTASRLQSLAPEAESAEQALTPEQNARRKRLQRLVAGVISGLLAFTALAGIVYMVKSRNEAALLIAEADAAAKAAPPAALEAAPAGASQPAPTAAATSPSGSDTTPALATTPSSVAPARSRARLTHPKPVQTRAVRPSSRQLLSH